MKWLLGLCLFVFVACGPDTITQPDRASSWRVTMEYHADSMDIGMVVILRAENVETGACYLMLRQGNSMDTQPCPDPVKAYGLVKEGDKNGTN